MLDFHQARVDLLKQRVTGLQRLLKEFDPNQPRVPKGSGDESGQWVSEGGSSGGGGGDAHKIGSHAAGHWSGEGGKPVWVSGQASDYDTGERHEVHPEASPVKYAAPGTPNRNKINENADKINVKAGRISEWMTARDVAMDEDDEYKEKGLDFNSDERKDARQDLRDAERELAAELKEYKDLMEERRRLMASIGRSGVGIGVGTLEGPAPSESERRTQERQAQESREAAQSQATGAERLQQQAEEFLRTRRATTSTTSDTGTKGGMEQQQQATQQAQQAAGGASVITQHPQLTPLADTAGLAESVARVTHRLSRATQNLSRAMAHGSGAISSRNDWGLAGQQLMAMRDNVKALRVELGHLLQERKHATGVTRSELNIAIGNVRGVLNSAHSTLKTFYGYIQRQKPKEPAPLGLPKPSWNAPSVEEVDAVPSGPTIEMGGKLHTNRADFPYYR